MTDTHLSDTRFSDLDLPEPLMRGIEATGFTHCTPIQALSLPLLLKDTDVAGQAQTGTGKTAAFLLAAFARLLRNEPSESRHKTQPRAVILAPTRELAIQIYNDAKELGRHTEFKMVLVYGGTGYDSQRKELIDGVDILIGTPGRIIDYYNQGVFDLSLTEVAILDEADRMFDLGFIKDVRFMLRRMPEPEKRLNMLFSATLSHRVAELAYEHMNEPTEVQVETENLTADNVKERMYYPSNDEKTPLLLGILRDIKAERVVVFVNTKHVTERLDDWLKMNDFKSGVISGDVPQKKRERLLEQFKEGSVRVLVATDVAARGLHIPNVSHVINFDLPQDAEDYVHRVGRTARAGASGEAISFACEKYAFSLMDIEKYVGHQLPVESVEPELMMLDAKRPAERERSRRGGRNDSRGGSRSRSGPPARGRDSRSGGATRERRPSQSGERTSPPRSSESGGGPRDGARDLNAEDRLHRERRPGRGARKTQTAESAESQIDTQPDSEKPTKPRGRIEPEIPAIG